MRFRQYLAAAAVTSASLLVGLSTSAIADPTPPVTDPHVLAAFPYSQGRTPENIALEPDGAADESFAFAAQIARVDLNGTVHTLAHLPSSPTTRCAFSHAHAVSMGLVRSRNGDLYSLLCTGNRHTQGVWRLTPQGRLTRIAALAVSGFPNGLALDAQERHLYVADSLLGTISRVDLADRSVTTWAGGPGSALAPHGSLGANGIKVHDGAVWATNTDRGTLLRIPINRDGSAGTVTPVAKEGLDGIDDIAFTSPRPHAEILAALNSQNEIALIDPDNGKVTIILTATGRLANVLSKPSSLAVRGDTLYVNNAAYFVTPTPNPNLLLAHLNLHR